MSEPLQPTGEQSLEHIAARILVCSPQSGLQRIATDWMRQWYRWQPGVLFRYGRLDLPGKGAETYLGGLTARKDLFVLVPEDLYEQRRRALLLQLARERLRLEDDATLYAYCDLAEQTSHDGSNQPAWDAEARARQVSYWLKLLAHRREVLLSDWRW